MEKAGRNEHVIKSPLKELDSHVVPLNDFSEFHPAVSDLFRRIWNAAGMDPRMIPEFEVLEEGENFISSYLNPAKEPLYTGWYSDAFSDKILRCKLSFSGKKEPEFRALNASSIISLFHEIFHKIVQDQNTSLRNSELKKARQLIESVGKDLREKLRKEGTPEDSLPKLHSIAIFRALFIQPDLLKKSQRANLEKVMKNKASKVDSIRKIDGGAAVYGTWLLTQILGDPALIEAEKQSMKIRLSEPLPNEEHIKGHDFFKTIIEEAHPGDGIEVNKRRLRELVNMIRTVPTDKELERLFMAAKDRGS